MYHKQATKGSSKCACLRQGSFQCIFLFPGINTCLLNITQIACLIQMVTETGFTVHVCDQLWIKYWLNKRHTHLSGQQFFIFLLARNVLLIVQLLYHTISSWMSWMGKCYLIVSVTDHCTFILLSTWVVEKKHTSAYRCLNET